MSKKTGLYFLIDLIIVFVTIIILSNLKTNSFLYLFYESKVYILGFISVWIFSSLAFGKCNFYKKSNFKEIVRPLLFSSILTLAIVSSVFVLNNIDNHTAFLIIGTITLTTFIEFIWSTLLYWVKITQAEPESNLNKAKHSKTYWNFQKYNTVFNAEKSKVNSEKLNSLISDFGIEPINYILNFVDINSEKTLLVQANSSFNIKSQTQDKFNAIINLTVVNNIDNINELFESVNSKLNIGGIFIGLFETKNLRKKRLLNKFPPIVNYVYYFFDFIIKRILPKINITKGLYLLLTRNQNKVLSIAETFGRIYSCGFELLDDSVLSNKLYFVAVKESEPQFPKNPTYGPLIKLKRIAWKGKKINVYKLRTMHPYSEFIQAYIYKKNGILNGDKAINDFRVTSWGKFFRTFWIDEIPMIYNLIKGDIKLVGVRPLSETKFKMYPKELQEKRVLYKPGLVPPFYADMPQSFEEHLATENKYLDLYSTSPIKTDFIYFFQAMFNIFFRKARSQ